LIGIGSVSILITLDWEVLVMGQVSVVAFLVSAWVVSAAPGLALAEVRGPERLWSAATFDDGNDKEAVVDLRARKARGEALTAMEEAILVAAARTGQIAICPGWASNAFLVRVNGRDAIITSLHAIFEPKSGQPTGGCDLAKAGYYPNLSFYDAEDGEITPSVFETTKIPTDGTGPLFIANANPYREENYKADVDFAVFFLAENASQDQLPDRSTRGFLRLASEVPNAGTVLLIGTNPDFRQARASAFQKCPFERAGSIVLFHACDTLPGSSSSVMLSYVRGEFVVLGMHVKGRDEVGLDASDRVNWNAGVSFVPIQKFLEEQGLTIE
jgi:hypothetical protein